MKTHDQSKGSLVKKKRKRRPLPAPGHRQPDPNCSTLEYSLQAFGAFFLFFLWSFSAVLSFWIPIWLIFFSSHWYLMVMYGLWFVYDFWTPAQGSRHLRCVRECKVWKWLADYYPIGLIKTVDLPPDRNYILCNHPHGFWCTGIFIHMLSDGTDFAKQFPGLVPSLLTLNGQFWFPFRREIGVCMGGVMSSRESLQYLLESQPSGRIIGIVVGGSREVLEAHVGRHFTFLKTRRGFCRFALRYGASLVPSYSFGENDLFFQYPNRPGSWLRRIQDRIKDKFGFCPPIYRGRGIFNRFFGLLPFRRPITTVVGKPIHVEKREDATVEEIDALHAKYVDALVELFEEHKSKFGIPEDKHLIIG
ncbi:hypothetical protein M3Y94_01017700 [Aphelenchoides besseyi]|nr:hypothetical protein M3Y94_01017700 [Aphelenchoides besseyi]KAI6220557.1 Acyltransferase [Aphelenchoides besseyi]